MSMNLAQLLQNLDSYTSNTDVTINYHDIINNTNDEHNRKDVINDVYNNQYGDKVGANSYNMVDHANTGHESFGLMNLRSFTPPQQPTFSAPQQVPNLLVLMI